MADLAEVVREEIAGLFAERFGDADEVLDVQTALIRLQPGQLRRRDLYAPGDLRLEPAFRFPELPEDSTVHAQSNMHAPCQLVNFYRVDCQNGKQGKCRMLCQSGNN